MAAYSASRQLPHVVARGGPRSLPHDKLGPSRSSSPNGRAAYDRHGCFGPPLPWAGAAWLGAVAADKPAQPPDVAQRIVANAQAQKDPLAALHALNDGYAKAPQNVKDELMRDPGALKIIDAADAWAKQPLQHADNEMMPHGQTAAALRRLDQATQGLDKTLAGLVVD